MVETVLDNSRSLTQSGGGDDTQEETQVTDTDSTAVQVEVGGSSTDADVHFDARLAGDANWVTDYFRSALTGKAADFDTILQMDTEDIHEIRIRIVNQDGSNGADTRVIVTHGDE